MKTNQSKYKKPSVIRFLRKFSILYSIFSILYDCVIFKRNTSRVKAQNFCLFRIFFCLIKNIIRHKKKYSVCEKRLTCSKPTLCCVSTITHFVETNNFTDQDIYSTEKFPCVLWIERSNRYPLQLITPKDIPSLFLKSETRSE